MPENIRDLFTEHEGDDDQDFFGYANDVGDARLPDLHWGRRNLHRNVENFTENSGPVLRDAPGNALAYFSLFWESELKGLWPVITGNRGEQYTSRNNGNSW